MAKQFTGADAKAFAGDTSKGRPSQAQIDAYKAAHPGTRYLAKADRKAPSTLVKIKKAGKDGVVRTTRVSVPNAVIRQHVHAKRGRFSPEQLGHVGKLIASGDLSL